MRTSLLWVAAVLAASVGLAHSYLGERYILMRLFATRSVPNLFGSDWFTKRTMRFAWHLTTIAWFGLAAVLVAISGGSNTNVLLACVACTFAIHAVFAFGWTRGRHLAWIVFAAIAFLTWMAR